VGAQLLSDSDLIVGYTLLVNTVLINPETERHSRHQFESSNRTSGDIAIEVRMTALECNQNGSILDACLNHLDGTGGALRGLDDLDGIHVGGDGRKCEHWSVCG